ncbi:hypothetical protein [Burkholderia gladioli]|uniref:hypothetical protein n=1 Tax=Burkholderia gladioli TaxID=28095 RepID=UPI003EE163BC
MADENLYGSRALGFNQGSPRGQDRQRLPAAPRPPLFIARDTSVPGRTTACSFTRQRDGTLRIESICVFTAGDSDGGECD